ncbi:MAG: UDP-N-acetylmuramoyl-L-alanyl-D-glutamate--2,6-diaminopimelate ligase [Deltaproteobacteria bacterium]|nr:UDP-N-acetylmuramoyl-L-alanyl-D-glutamate--2,6-diaminopimelate ligase [Deltaproteobacteria bacterium]
MAKNIREIMAGVDVISWQGLSEGEVRAVFTDSRKCLPRSLFVAQRGVHYDGHNFIANAIASGAHFVIAEEECRESSANVGVITVADSQKALGIVARNFYDNPSSKILMIGVSGTNGKTTTTYIIESILQSAGLKVGVIGTIDYRYGGKSVSAPNTTPDSLTLNATLREMLDASVNAVVMEVSSHAVVLGRVATCHFDFGIFTNLSHDHLDFHHDMESYFNAKRYFFLNMVDAKRMPHLSINIDDSYGMLLVREKLPEEIVGYGMGEGAGVTAKSVIFSLGGIKADVVCRGKDNLCFPITCRLIGEHNLFNILAAVSATLSLGVSPEHIQEGLANLRNVPGRLERLECAEPMVFVDYAHTPDGLERTITHLLLVKKKRLITVFGCGGNRDRTKRGLMGAIATAKSDITIITSDNPREESPMAIIDDILGGVGAKSPRAESLADLTAGSYIVIPERKEAIAAAIAIAEVGDIVLIAGKGHEKYQEIKGVKHFFDDMVIAREAIKNPGGAR